MERGQLEGLTIKDLKYYTRSRCINSPINANQRELVEIILGYQAKRLSELARKAIAQVQGDTGVTGRDFETVDISRLEPYTSAYSGQTGRSTVGSSVDRESDGGRTGVTDREQPSGATGGGSGSTRTRAGDTTGQSSRKKLKKVDN